MKQTQIKYAIERIEAIVKTKREAIRIKYKHVLDFSDNDKVAMIKNTAYLARHPYTLTDIHATWTVLIFQVRPFTLRKQK